MKRCISLSWHLQSCQKCFRKLVLQHLKWFISFCRNLTQKLCPIEFLKFMHLLKSLKCSIKKCLSKQCSLIPLSDCQKSKWNPFSFLRKSTSNKSRPITAPACHPASGTVEPPELIQVLDRATNRT